MTLTCSSKVCSFGKQVVEKVEMERAQLEDGRFVYRLLRSPMCEYLVNFLHKLRQLPERYMMNSVLENFTILQLIFVSAAAEDPRSHGPMADHVTLQVALSSHSLEEQTVLLPGGSKWVESGERKKQSARDLFRCFPCLGRCGGEAVTRMYDEVGDADSLEATERKASHSTFRSLHHMG
ncbi:hypothetical protein MG293_020697 [Ovis ammon polii]|uniref:YAP binding domain-containing protein n=1 Tax=Ovis ammon polii TaxID=230172 RepID=A0AAD4XZF8_OVIAM|nr:hypothetical protein MG293_020697 [Ovis ammon polii]KAI4550314.1 hypothetical protein MJT46_019040 [Ovis ammon polii x Ovis aries]